MDLLFEASDSNSSLIAGTLPSVLRRLTNVSSGSQFESWALLVSIREYSSARYVFDFLRERYELTSESVARIRRSARASGRLSSGRSADSTSSSFVPDLQRHALGPELLFASSKTARQVGQFSNATSSSLSPSRGESAPSLPQGSAEAPPAPEFVSETFVEVKLGTLLFLETWLSCFPEDFMGTPQDTARSSMHQVDASAQHSKERGNAGEGQSRISSQSDGSGACAARGNYWDEGGETPARTETNVNGTEYTSDAFRRDALTYLIDFVKTSILSCPLLPLLGVNFRNSKLSSQGILHQNAVLSGMPFRKLFPCIYKVANLIDLDISRENNSADSSLSLGLGAAPSDRGDGFIRSIIPLASVVCALNARSKLKRIPISAMHRFYDRSAANEILSAEEASIRLLTPVKVNGSVDVTSNEDSCTEADAGSDANHLARQRSDDFNSSATFVPWHESEALQSSKLRSTVIEALAKHYMEPFRLVMQQYSRVAAALRSAEMIAAEDETIFDITDIPIKVFITPVDKHFLTYNYSKTRGFNPVAANMVSLKHNGAAYSSRSPNTAQGAAGTPPKDASKLVNVNLNEVIKTGASFESSDDAYGSYTTEQDMYEDRESYDYRNDNSVNALIVPDDDLLSALHQQMADDQNFTLRPLELWKRRQRRFELERRLKQWREDHMIPSGIDHILSSPSRVKPKFLRDSHKQSWLLQFTPSLLTYHLTLKLHYLFCTIPMLEFLVHAGFSERSRREVPMLARFRAECDRMQDFLVNEILSEEDTETRAKVIVHLVLMAETAVQCWSHHLLMLIVQALQCHPVHRLKRTWKIVNRIIPERWQKLQEKVGFGGSSLLSMQMCRFIEQGLKPDLRSKMYLRNPRDAVAGAMDATNSISAAYLAHLERTLVLGESVGVLCSDATKSSMDDRSSNEDSVTGCYTVCINPETNMIGGLGFEKADDDIDASFGVPDAEENARGSGLSGGTEEEGKGGGGGEEEVVIDVDESRKVPFAPQWDGELRGSSFSYRKNLDDPGPAVSSPSSAPIAAAGIVRERNTDARLVFLGLPCVAPEAGMPYVPGVISKLIRLSELPEYLRDPEDPNEMLFVLSPGVFPDDQRLPMLNMGKLRSVARWLMLLRAAQLSPYKFDEKAVNKDIFARLMKPPAFSGHDAQWERSVALEKKS